LNYFERRAHYIKRFTGRAISKATKARHSTSFSTREIGAGGMVPATSFYIHRARVILLVVAHIPGH
jgi:hypothetical protein